MSPKRYKYSGFSDYQETRVFVVEWLQWDSRRVQGGLQKWGGAPAGSQGALGKADQVQWGPFWEVLDLQNVVRA